MPDFVMKSEQTQTEWYYDFLGWLDTHRKQAIQVAVALVILGLIVSFFLWSRGQKEENASRELSKLVLTRASADQLLNFQTQNRNTSAGEHALLLAAQDLFDAGKYADAQAQFQKFRSEYRSSPLASTAAFGVAASLEAQGKTDDAINAYNDLVQRRVGEMIIVQAQFALGRLYEAKKDFEKAVTFYDNVVKDGGNLEFANDAYVRAAELRMQYPTLAKATPPPSAELPTTIE